MSDRSTRKTDEKSAKDLKKNYSLNSSENREKRKYTVKTAAHSAGAMYSAETGRHMSDSFSGCKNDVRKMKKSAAAKGMTDRKAEKNRKREKSAYIKENMRENTSSSYYESTPAEQGIKSGSYSDNFSSSAVKEEKAAEKASERTAFEQRREISPEMQERMKRAAYIKENMQESIKASYKEEFNAPAEQELNSDNYSSSGVKEERKVNEITAEKTAGQMPFEQRREISPEMRERIKKAAYIKENLQKDIDVSRLTSADETAEEQLTAAETIAVEDMPENVVEDENTSYISRYLGNTENIFDDEDDGERKAAAVKNAYEKEILKKQAERRKNAISMNYQLETNAALLSAQRARKAAEGEYKKDTEAQENRRDITSAAEFAAREISAIKSGNAVKAAAQPVAGVLRNSLDEKTLNAVDDITSVSGTVQNSDSVGSAAANMGINLAADRIKRSVRDLYISRDNKEKAEKRLEEKLLHIDRKTNEKISRINSRKEEAMNGNISGRLEKRLSKIERKQDKYKEKLAKKQKEFQRNQQKEIYIKHNRDNPSFAPNVIKNSKTYMKKKTKAALVGGGAVSASLPIFVIIIVFLIIAAFFSWINPFKFVLAGSEEEKSAEKEEEILDAYILEIQNYMDIAQMQCFETYGTYCDAHYNWEALVPDWEGYYEKFVKPKIEEATKAIQESYRESLAASKGDSAVVEAMVKEIQEAIAKIIEQARKDYQEILDNLNDIYIEPVEGDDIIHYVPLEGYTEHTKLHGGKNEVWDVGEYNGKTCDGTNHFSLGSLQFETDLTAEDLFQLIALSRALDVINSNSGGDEETETSAGTTVSGTETSTETGSEAETIKKPKKEFAELTTEEINDFFKRTEFITIEAHLDKGECNGTCHRKLVGDWDSGWSVLYYCTDPDNAGDEPCHTVLSGNIRLKTKEEMIETVMQEYGAEKAKMDRDDVDEILENYEKYIKKTLGTEEKRYFGSNDSSRAIGFYNTESGGNPIPNKGIWEINTPMETDKTKAEEAKETEEENDKKTESKSG